MRSIIFSFTVFLFSVLSANAQNDRYGNFDFEFGFEVPLLAASHEGKTNNIVPGIHLEGRWQLESQPIDIGFHIGVSVIKRRFGKDYENYRAWPFMVISDYQFGRGKRFNPYVGLGMGVSMNVIVNTFGRDEVDFVISPRAGIRCFKFLNLALGYHLTHKDYSRLYGTLGFYF